MGTESTGDAGSRGSAGPGTGPGAVTAGVDWSELDGAYGPATEVPEALEGLTDPELADDALDDLYSTVLHQGSLYPASGPAVLEVARLLAAGRCADPTGALSLVAYYSQCVQEHRAALAFLRAYPRGYRRAEERLGEYRARLDEAVDVLAPLLAGLGSFDPLAAQALTLLQGRRSRLGPQRAAVLGELASAGSGPEGGPDAAIARAAAFVLGRHGLGVPDTPEARTCALLGRVAGSRASEEDARTLAADWSTALGVADVCLNELTDDIPDPSLPMWLALTDPPLAAEVLTALPADAGGASTEVIEALTEAALRSRGATPPARERLLELAERPDADPDTMVGALRLMRSRPEVRDALARLVARPEALRPSRHRGTPRTDAAYALALQGDERWAGLLASALRARPDPSDLRLNGMTGFVRDFAGTGAAPTPELLDAVAGLLTDPAATDDAVGAVLDLVGGWAERWPASLLSSLVPVLERVRADRPPARSRWSALRLMSVLLPISVHAPGAAMTLADATSTDDRHDRATGALAGLALGDALGMPTQALSPASITRLYGAVTGLVDASPEQPYAPLAPAGSVTDDTEQAWLLAEQLLDPSPDSGGAGHIEPRALAQALMNWEEDMIDRGSLDLLGPSTKAALEELRAGAEPGTTGRTGTTNGAAMRVTPVGIAYTTGAPAAWEPLFGTGGHACLTAFGQAVRESCLVTHNTIQGFQAAGLVAAAVSHGIDGADTLTAVHLAQATVASLPAQGTWAPNASVLAVASSAVEYAADHAGDDASFLMWVRDHVGTCVESTESIPTALALAVRYRHRPWEGLLAAANLGGDTDTIGAITGAILGATHGVRAFPAQALARVQAVSDLDPGALAARLLRLRRRNDPVEVSQKAGAGRPAHPSGAADPAAHPGGQVGSAGPSVGPAQPVGRVLHLGEVLIDLSMRVPNLPPRGGDVFATSHDMSPGGGFNVLAAVRQWGCDAVYCGALGTGPMARMARAALDSIGVLHAGPTLSTHDTGVSVALTEADGERSFISTAGAETLTPPECYQHLAVGEQDLVYLSGYSLCAPATREGLLRFASSHAGLPPRPDGVPRVLVDASPMVGELDLSDLQALGALRPLWSLSEREAHILTGRLGDQGDAGASGPDSPREAAGALAKYLGSPVLVRAGAQGAWFVDMLDGTPPADPVHVPTVPVTPVDTNGAGDAHAGVLAAALVQGAPLRRALVLANCAGALSTLTAGPATCPERHSIEQAAGALSKRMSVMTLR